jgi:hypothetical protein
VPVILYEEMSDKAIDDYDENHREVLLDTTSSGGGGGGHGGGGTLNSNYYTTRYRSPLILRNEKPPVPAPPEYSKYHNGSSSDTNSMMNTTPRHHHTGILNELHMMLQQDIPRALDVEDESMALINNTNNKTNRTKSDESFSIPSSSPQMSTQKNRSLFQGQQ